jgi:uncharacterized protein YbjT (DUF2867 family)
MRVLVFGATGRVGSAAVRFALEAGHEVAVFVRNPDKLARDAVTVKVGDVTDPPSVAAAVGSGIDAVINAVGVDPLKPSTFVTDAARVLVREVQAAGVARYIGVSGTAQMRKTLFGRIGVGILGLTPVRHAIADHQGAYDIVTASTLDWTLSGCPWIKDTAPPPARMANMASFPVA